MTNLLVQVIRKLIIWLGAFAIGTAPSAVLAKVFPTPFSLFEYAEAANDAGIFREFLFLAVSVSGIAILNTLDNLTFRDRRYPFTDLLLLSAVILLVVFIVYILLTMAEMQPGVPLLPSEMVAIFQPVKLVIYAALGVELVLALNVARANVGP